MLQPWFFDHPQSVGETYGDHQRVAWRFALRLIGAGLACAVHGLVPGLFTQTGSRTVQELHTQMVENRRKQVQPEAVPASTRAQ